MLECCIPEIAESTSQVLVDFLKGVPAMFEIYSPDSISIKELNLNRFLISSVPLKVSTSISSLILFLTRYFPAVKIPNLDLESYQIENLNAFS